MQCHQINTATFAVVTYAAAGEVPRVAPRLPFFQVNLPFMPTLKKGRMLEIRPR